MPASFGPGPISNSAAADREHELARRHPDRETLELAAAGAAQVLGPDHGVTKALARASITMAKVDLWQARLAVKTLHRDQREAIAEVGGRVRHKIGTRSATGRGRMESYRGG